MGEKKKREHKFGWVEWLLEEFGEGAEWSKYIVLNWQRIIKNIVFKE